MTQQTMPAVFFGHGSPMNALEKNRYTDAWEALGKEIPRPAAVLAVSAHWYVPGTAVTASPRPRTIHDFGGFPPELHRFEYPARGAPALAERVHALLAPRNVTDDQRWGLDHGVWSVLCHLYPDASVPVVELSIDATLPPAGHYELARRLSPLRDEGVLITASGNVVHNLRAMRFSRDGSPVPPEPWAQQFEDAVRNAILANDVQALIDYDKLTPDAALAAPDIDHYLPLLYTLGVRRDGETPSFPTSGIDGGAISMLSVRYG